MQEGARSVGMEEEAPLEVELGVLREEEGASWEVL